jgi:hypothetical protein
MLPQRQKASHASTDAADSSPSPAIDAAPRRHQTGLYGKGLAEQEAMVSGAAFFSRNLRGASVSTPSAITAKFKFHPSDIMVRAIEASRRSVSTFTKLRSIVI